MAAASGAEVAVWDLATLRPRARRRLEAPIHRLAFDGPTALIASHGESAERIAWGDDSSRVERTRVP